MLHFDLHAPGQGKQSITLEPAALIVAGWTGRDEAALRHHIEELAAIEMELEDPVLGRMLKHAYDIKTLPVVS